MQAASARDGAPSNNNHHATGHKRRAHMNGSDDDDDGGGDDDDDVSADEENVEMDIPGEIDDNTENDDESHNIPEQQERIASPRPRAVKMSRSPSKSQSSAQSISRSRLRSASRSRSKSPPIEGTRPISEHPVLTKEEKWKLERRKKLEAAAEQSLSKQPSVVVSSIRGLTLAQLRARALRPIEKSEPERALLARVDMWERVLLETSPPTSDATSRSSAHDRSMKLYAGCNGFVACRDLWLEIRKSLTDLTVQLNVRKKMTGPIQKKLDGLSSVNDSLFAYPMLEMDLQARNSAMLKEYTAVVAKQDQAGTERLAQEQSEWSPFARLLNEILNRIQRMKLVRIDKRVWEPVMYNGRFTRAYKEWKSGDILEIALNICSDQSKEPELWGMIWDRPNNWKQIAAILEFIQDARFPEVALCRNYMAFRNGVYDVNADTFYEYDSPIFRLLPDTVVCCVYHDVVFDFLEYEYEMAHGKWTVWDAVTEKYVERTGESVLGIRTVPLETITHTQKWTEDTIEWYYASGGRVLHPVGQWESWAVMFMHIGQAGTGKTVSCRAWKAMLPHHKANIINNNCERTFPLDGWDGGYAWFGMDIDRNWQLDQTLWNTLVDGGLLGMARKYMKVKQICFDQHGTIATNAIMKWRDTNGNFLRRLVPLPYPCKPLFGDGSLQKHIEGDIGRVIKKCNVAYKTLCDRKVLDDHNRQRRLGDVMLRHHHLPAQIVKVLTQLKHQTNPFFEFMESENVMYHEKLYIDVETLLKEYTQLRRQTGHAREEMPNINDTFFADVFEAKRIELTKEKVAHPTSGDHQDVAERFIVKGCTLKAYYPIHPNAKQIEESKKQSAPPAPPAPPPPRPAVPAKENKAAISSTTTSSCSEEKKKSAPSASHQKDNCERVSSQVPASSQSAQLVATAVPASSQSAQLASTAMSTCSSVAAPTEPADVHMYVETTTVPSGFVEGAFT